VDSYAQIIEGIHNRLATIYPDGLQGYQNGEPSAIQVTPFAYTVFGRLEGAHKAGGRIRDYIIPLRVVVKWQDNVNAELELMQFLPGGDYSIIALITDEYPGEVVAGCLTETYEAEGGFLPNVGGTAYRIADFDIHVRDKTAE
jgi:hypothetical protein